MVIYCQGSFVQGFGQCWVREDYYVQVFGVGVEFYVDCVLLYQFGGVWVDYVDVQDVVGFCIGDDFDQVGGVVGCYCMIVGGEWEGVDVDFDVFGFEGLFGFVDLGDFWVGVDD